MANGSEVGTVFVTGAHGRATIWVVVERHEDLVRYVRVTPGHLAGTVEVRLAHGRAEVTYDLTALSEEAEPELDASPSATTTSWPSGSAQSPPRMRARRALP